MDGDYFVANHVFLEEGENTLTIKVTDADGNTTTALITVNYNPTDSYIIMTVDEESGIAPFETTLRVEGTLPVAVANYILNRKRNELADLEKRYGINITINSDDSLAPGGGQLEFIRG